jgi:outer membrane protein
MKNVSLVLNIVLLVAVGVLFWLFFTSKKAQSPTKQINFGDKNMRIAFVDIARLDTTYKYITDRRYELNQKEDNMRRELSNVERGLAAQQQSLQEDAASLENDPKISMTEKYNRQKELQVRYENFQAAYEQYSRRKDDMEKKLNDDLNKFNKEMMDNLFNNIKKYNADQKYDYILARQYQGGLLAANDSLDITEDILTMLNEEYKTQNGAK